MPIQFDLPGLPRDDFLGNPSPTYRAYHGFLSGRHCRQMAVIIFVLLTHIIFLSYTFHSIPKKSYKAYTT